MSINPFRCLECSADQQHQRPADDSVTCDECASRRPFVLGDVISVSGCPGTGKSTIGSLLVRRLGPEFVVVETDALNQPADDVDEHTWASFVERLLRLAVCLAQGGRTLVLVGYSTPWQWEEQPLRRFLGRIHHLALVCSDSELDRRLRRRPWMDRQERESLLGLNRRFREMPDVHRIDTTTAAPAAVADQVSALIAT